MISNDIYDQKWDLYFSYTAILVNQNITNQLVPPQKQLRFLNFPNQGKYV